VAYALVEGVVFKGGPPYKIDRMTEIIKLLEMSIIRDKVDCYFIC